VALDSGRAAWSVCSYGRVECPGAHLRSGTAIAIGNRDGTYSVIAAKQRVANCPRHALEAKECRLILRGHSIDCGQPPSLLVVPVSRIPHRQIGGDDDAPTFLHIESEGIAPDRIVRRKTLPVIADQTDRLPGSRAKAYAICSPRQRPPCTIDFWQPPKWLIHSASTLGLMLLSI